MAAVPQGMFAARKVRANMNTGWERSLLFESRQEQQGKQQSKQEQSGGSSWGRQQSGTKDTWGSSPFPKLNQQMLDHPPAKYNSKLMNSIWGLYNRYSVHNFKKITGDLVAFGQQPHPALPESCMIPGSVAANANGVAPPRGTGSGPNTNPAGASPATAATPSPWENFLAAAPEYRH